MFQVGDLVTASGNGFTYEVSHIRASLFSSHSQEIKIKSLNKKIGQIHQWYSGHLFHMRIKYIQLTGLDKEIHDLETMGYRE